MLSIYTLETERIVETLMERSKSVNANGDPVLLVAVRECKRTNEFPSNIWNCNCLLFHFTFSQTQRFRKKCVVNCKLLHTENFNDIKSEVEILC